ncbi:MAG TPA: hypothetical protein DCS93_01790 [Microscillaceae bacterium]|nr:hypothetical protein [Microscillaceae bacterium]
MKKLLTISLFCLFATVVVAQGQTNTEKPCPAKIKQGIYGKVIWQEGNQMPGPGNNQKKMKPVKRELWVYFSIQRNDLVKQGKLFQAPDVKPVAKVESDENGCFQLKLPAGSYSIFTVEKNGLFANLFDGRGIVAPFEVTQGKVTQVDIMINYRSLY